MNNLRGIKAELYLGIDLGTSSVKCVLQDQFGRIVNSASRAYPTTHFCPGWEEQNPVQWFRAAIDAVREVVAEQDATQVLAIGICGAAHIPVLLDNHMELVRPAILWTDQRSNKQAQELNSNLKVELLSTCFNQASPTWTLPQLIWLQKHEPSSYARVSHLLLGKDYITYRLTGELVTDEGNAASSLMMDMRSKNWASHLAQLAGLSIDALPPILAPHAIAGHLQPDVAAQLGLPAGVPVIAGMLDSVAELLSLGIASDSEAMLRLGTAGGVMVVSREPHPHPGMITYPYLFDRGWCCQAFNNSCATAVTWVRDLLGRDESGKQLAYSELDSLAATAPVGAEGLLFHPYLLGERAPLWDPNVRASFIGASIRHHRGHFARAVLEGLAFSIKECHDTLIHGGYTINSVRLTGAGAKSSLWRQILSDVFGMPMAWAGSAESAVGAALLAAIGIGRHSDLDAAIRCAKSADCLVADPQSENCVKYESQYSMYKEVRRVLQPIYHRASEHHQQL